MIAQTLAKEVESRYRNELRTKFPYADCYKLQRIRPDLTAGLIPETWICTLVSSLDIIPVQLHCPKDRKKNSEKQSQS